MDYKQPITSVPAEDQYVKQFNPSRKSPIYARAFRRYTCRESVAQTTDFRNLTFKIQQPNNNLVFNSVKLCLPLSLKCEAKDGSDLSMRITNRLPACNIAVSQYPWKCFKHISLAVNGKVYSQNCSDYGYILGKCYSSKDKNGDQDTHSLKAIVNRDFSKRAVTSTYVTGLHRPSGGSESYVIADYQLQTSDAAFSLLESNSGMIARARNFQQGLADSDGYEWRDTIVCNLDIGPFAARIREDNSSNGAVPYCRDLNLSCRFKQARSKLDQDNRDPEKLDSAGRKIVQGLFEFGTPANQRHYPEQVDTSLQYPADYIIKWTDKPYLLVEYVEYSGPMEPSYELKGYDYLFNRSDPFQMGVPKLGVPVQTKTVRCLSRLLSVPSKIYIWADLGNLYKDSFIFGGCDRQLTLKNLKIRCNQVQDALQDPSIEMCYHYFKRLTNSSWGFSTYRKSPVYVFSPTEIGIEQLLANNARITSFEVTADAELTPLMIEEYDTINDGSSMFVTGYKVPGTVESFAQNGDSNLFTAAYDNGVTLHLNDNMVPKLGNLVRFALSTVRVTDGGQESTQEKMSRLFIDIVDDNFHEYYFRDKYIRHSQKTGNPGQPGYQPQFPEILGIADVRSVQMKFTNMLWTRIKKTGTATQLVSLYMVGMSWDFTFTDTDGIDRANFYCGIDKIEAQISEEGVFQHWKVVNGQLDEILKSAHKGYVHIQGRSYPWNALPTGPDMDRHIGVAPALQAIPVEGNIANGIGLVQAETHFLDGTRTTDGGQTHATGSNFHKANPSADEEVWVCVGPVVNDLFKMKADGTDYTKQRETAEVVLSLNRGQFGTPQAQLELRNTTNGTLSLYDIRSAAYVTEVANKMDYELKCLFEFGNNQIVHQRGNTPAFVKNNLVAVADPRVGAF